MLSYVLKKACAKSPDIGDNPGAGRGGIDSEPITLAPLSFGVFRSSSSLAFSFAWGPRQLSEAYVPDAALFHLSPHLSGPRSS